LRTLVCAFRDIPISEYNEWNSKFEKASNVVTTKEISREKELEKVGELIEKGLFIHVCFVFVYLFMFTLCMCLFIDI